MRKTRITATIGQLNPATGEYSYTDHKVYADDFDCLFSLVNGERINVLYRQPNGRKIKLSYPIKTR